MDPLALFSTPVVVFQMAGMDDVNADLAERLRAEAETTPGVPRSIVGGWHSPPDLGNRPEPCFRALMQQVLAHVSRVVGMVAGAVEPPRFRLGMCAWAVVMRDGDYTVVHDHGDAHWSTVYYVDAGDADEAAHPESGRLVLLDPRHCGRPIPFFEACSSEFAIRPRTGTLVVFPAWLQHYVHPYRGTRPRVSVSCNVIVEPEAPGPRLAPARGSPS